MRGNARNSVVISCNSCYMNLVENKIVHLLTGKHNLREVSVSELEAITQEQPFFSVAQLLLAKKMKQENHPGFHQQVAKTALYFPNTYWLDHQLNTAAEEETQVYQPAARHTWTESVSVTTAAPEQEEPAVSNEQQVSTPVAGTEQPKLAEPAERPNEEPVEEAAIPAAAADQPLAGSEQQAAGQHSEAATAAEPEHSTVNGQQPGDQSSTNNESLTDHTQPVAAGETDRNWSLPTGDLYPDEEISVLFNQPAEEPAAPEQPAEPETVSVEVQAFDTSSSNWHFDHINEEQLPQPPAEPVEEAAVPAPEAGSAGASTSNWYFDREETAAPAAGSEQLAEAAPAAETAANDQPSATGEPPGNEPASTGDQPPAVNEDAYEHSIKESFRAAHPETLPPVDEDQLPVTEIGETGEGVSNSKLAELLQQQADAYHQPVDAQSELPIEAEPYHTVDYFASQGIKLEAEPAESDVLGKKVRKFTDWLKQMKRINPQPVDLGTTTELEQVVQSIAANSNEARDIVTEAMAEVLVKQGKTDKAIQLYSKLSFLNPGKSAYFAAKIIALKDH